MDLIKAGQALVDHFDNVKGYRLRVIAKCHQTYYTGGGVNPAERNLLQISLDKKVAWKKWRCAYLSAQARFILGKKGTETKLTF